MNLPWVSIITVCYNAADFVETTINSVLSQSYPNIQYIIIDGASIDGTIDIVKKYSKRISVIVSEPDKGIYDAMNKGMKYVKGEWVNFMNAGDTFHDENVVNDIFGENSILAADISKLQVIGGNTYNVCSENSWEHFAEPASVIPFRLPFSHQACFVRPPFSFDLKYKIAADYKILYDAYFRYGEKSICSINYIIADYQKDGSFSTVNFRKAKAEYLRIQSSHLSVRWIKEFVKYIFKIQ